MMGANAQQRRQVRDIRFGLQQGAMLPETAWAIDVL
jgi:hypothetical protein